MLSAIKEEAKLALKQKDIDILKKISYNKPKDSNELRIAEIKNEQANLQQEKANMLRMLAKGTINESDYNSFQEEIENEQQRYRELEVKFKDKQSRKEYYLTQHDIWTMHFIDYIDIEEITREVLIALVEEIKVFEDKQIEITFKFRSPFVQEN